MATETKIIIGGGGSMSFLALLSLLFIGLKLGHVIEWSWWLVTLPLWGGFAIWGCLLFFALFLYVLAVLLKR
jgi:hypothetical protein